MRHLVTGLLCVAAALAQTTPTATSSPQPSPASNTAGATSDSTAALDAVNDWDHLRQLVGGVDIRVTESGKKPRTMKLGEVRPDALIVINGNQESALDRASIERVELVLASGRKRLLPGAKSVLQEMPAGEPTRVVTGGAKLESRDGNYVIVYQRPITPAR